MLVLVVWTFSTDQTAMVEKHSLQTPRWEAKGRFPFHFWPPFDSFSKQAK